MRIIPPLIAIVMLAACNKPYTPFEIPCQLSKDSSECQRLIQGTWKWVEERVISRTRGEEYLTPKTEGYTLSLTLQNGIATYFKNGVQWESFGYRIIRFSEATNFPEDSIPVLAYYDLNTGQRQSIVPIQICDQCMLMQNQMVTSYGGEKVWVRN